MNKTNPKIDKQNQQLSPYIIALLENMGIKPPCKLIAQNTKTTKLDLHNEPKCLYEMTIYGASNRTISLLSMPDDFPETYWTTIKKVVQELCATNKITNNTKWIVIKNNNFDLLAIKCYLDGVEIVETEIQELITQQFS
jgi:hypothetical protein